MLRKIWNPNPPVFNFGGLPSLNLTINNLDPEDNNIFDNNYRNDETNLLL